MIKYYKNRLFSAILFCLGVLGGTAGCAVKEKGEKPPLFVPFAVERAGNRISFDMIITEAHIYSIQLRYLYEKGDRDRVWKLVGGSIKDESGKWIELGAPVTLHINVTQTENDAALTKLDEQVIAPRLSSSGDGVLNAKIDDIQLAPGRYTITAESLKDAPELASFTTQLSIVRAYLGK